MPVGKVRKVRKDKGGNYPRFFVHEKRENVFVNGQQKKKLPPLQILKWLFRYEESTGKLYRIRESSGKAIEPEREIVYVNSSGYLLASITDSNGLMKLFMVHQLIYYIASGVEPLQVVDHIDGDPLNNLFSNLRLATESLNNRNAKMRSHNTSGITGIHWYKPTGKWRAMATDNSGKKKYLGYYSDKDEAIEVISAWYANPENNFSERHGLNASISTCTDV